MAEVGFYHLTRTGPDVALPALLGRTLAAGQRALVLCGSAERVQALDRTLWEAARPDWLPHGSARTGHAALQPIWLAPASDGPVAAGEAPNGARFLFLIDGVEAAAEGWDRVFDLFDGGDEPALAAARRRWAAVRAAGHAATYWKQGESGWVKG